MRPEPKNPETAIDLSPDDAVSISSTESSFVDALPLSQLVQELLDDQPRDGASPTASVNAVYSSANISSLLRSSTTGPDTSDVANMSDFLGEFLGENAMLTSEEYGYLNNITYPTGRHGEINLHNPPPLDIQPDSPSDEHRFRPEVFDCSTWPTCVSKSQYLQLPYFPGPPSCNSGDSSTIPVEPEDRNIIDFLD